MTTIADPHELINAIEEWYLQNGTDELIPDNQKSHHGIRFIEAFNKYNPTSVNYSGGTFDEIGTNLFPLMVAIRLGFSISKVKDIIAHHSIDISEIEKIDFPDESNVGDAIIVRKNGTPCTRTDFVSIVFQAMDLIPSKGYELARCADSKSIIQIGLMHTNNSDAWPATHIKSSAVLAQQEDLVVSIANNNFDHIVTNLDGLASLPNSSPMDFLKRSGMLLPEAAKRATAHYTFWEEMAESSMKGNECCTQILEYCANHTNLGVQASVKQALASLGGYEFMEEPGAMHNHLKSIFDNDAYRDSLRKVIPRINLVPYEPSEFLAYFPDDPEYCDFLRNKEDLLSVVAKEVLEMDVDQLGYNQLYVFSKLKHLELPAQRVDGFSPEDLINHVLDGINRYVAKAELIPCHKKNMDREVAGSLAELITLIQLNHKVDYSKFEWRTSSEKCQLVESGFSVKKMTGLTYQDKAHIFRNELNI